MLSCHETALAAGPPPARAVKVKSISLAIRTVDPAAARDQQIPVKAVDSSACEPTERTDKRSKAVLATSRLKIGSSSRECPWLRPPSTMPLDPRLNVAVTPLGIASIQSDDARSVI